MAHVAGGGGGGGGSGGGGGGGGGGVPVHYEQTVRGDGGGGLGVATLLPTEALAPTVGRCRLTLSNPR